jgi:hypothetical protein
MRCLFCGSEMRLDQVDKNESVSVSGYEWHTFRCSSCGDVERRLALSTGSNASHAEPAPPIQTVSTDKQAAAPQCGDVERRLASSTGSGPGHAEPAPAIQTVSTDKQAAALYDVVGPVFGKVAGVYTRLRRLVLRRQVPAPTRSLAAARATVESGPARVARSKTPTLPHSADAPVDSGLLQKDLDGCEELLKPAIKMLHGAHRSPEMAEGSRFDYKAPLKPGIEVFREPTRSAQIAVRPDFRPAESPALAPFKLNSDPEPPARKPLVVEIHYDLLKGRYAATDASTRLLLFRHEDRARLRSMCERMGWQLVDDVRWSAEA